MANNTARMQNGSAKQIAWAEQLKDEGMVKVRAAVAAANDHCVKNNTLDDPRLAKIQSAAALVEGINDAQWWISNRGMSAATLMQTAIAQKVK